MTIISATLFARPDGAVRSLWHLPLVPRHSCLMVQIHIDFVRLADFALLFFEGLVNADGIVQSHYVVAQLMISCRTLAGCAKNKIGNRYGDGVRVEKERRGCSCEDEIRRRDDRGQRVRESKRRKSAYPSLSSRRRMAQS